jgi:hypothetical protein
MELLVEHLSRRRLHGQDLAVQGLGADTAGPLFALLEAKLHGLLGDVGHAELEH